MTRWWHVDPLGAGVASAVAVLALAPGLLPRDGIVQGVVSGGVAALGYGVGALLSSVVGRPRGGRVVALVGVAVFGAALVVAAGWQRDAAALIGARGPSTPEFLLALPVTVGAVVVAAAVGRGFRALTRLVRRRGVRRRGGAALVVVAVTLLVVAAVVGGGLALTERAFLARNGEPGAATAPVGTTRSGSPTSLVAWDTLGRDGQRFVTGGAPGAVRVYVGLTSAPDPPQRAALAAAEIERAGGFDRAVLALATPTGSGAVDPQVPDSLELAGGGDTAMAAVQYSTLPSDLSFLLDGTAAQDQTRALVAAVRERLDRRPPDRRPRLLLYGQSLGSFGSQAAFGSLDEVRAQVDGVLWVGPPHASEPWAGLAARRDPASPEVLPLVDGGRAVRFAGRASDLASATPWERPRVLYLQHPSDPVVWWSPDLLWRRPDRLAEPAGFDVPRRQPWLPVITFWVTTVDLARAQSVPPDHGHRYDALLVDGWRAVLPGSPPG
ncbi:alpha/beta-hydrolase family protein [Actinomycetospora aeridis]|uniref:Alpha/beta-hydrolase family protein n=1 Tax=Actinomycetospora aeridis TaxID=3129231 RepID=A0ABU8N4J4_9PSEU